MTKYICLLLLLLFASVACEEQGRVVKYKVTVYKTAQPPTTLEFIGDWSNTSSDNKCRQFYWGERFVGEACGTYTVQVEAYP